MSDAWRGDQPDGGGGGSGSTELGHATTRTVVSIGTAVLIADFLLTQLFFIV